MAVGFDYEGMTQTADELIKFFGMAAVLRREGIADRPCTVVIFDNPRERPSDLANPIDRKVFMSAANSAVIATPPDAEKDNLVTFVQPPTNPLVEDETLPMTCKPKKTAPAGKIVVWEFTVRR